MSQQNLNKIYSQVRDTEYILSSSIADPTVSNYQLTKYDSGKVFILENDGDTSGPVESLSINLPKDPSNDLLGWNAKFICVSSSVNKPTQQSITIGAESGSAMTFTGSITPTIGAGGWIDLLSSSNVIAWVNSAGPARSTVEVTCTEAGPTEAECTFIFRVIS